MAKGDIKRRREIERLSASLPSMNAEQRKEATQLCGTAWIGARKGWCDVCAQEFDSETLWDSRKKTTVCPHCGARVEMKRSPRKQKNMVRYYYQVVTTCEGWQVVRTYFCTRSAKRVERYGTEILAHSDVLFTEFEVFQRWYKPDTQPMIIGIGLRGMHYYSDQWKWDSPWKIRREQTAYTLWGWVSKNADILPELKKKGLKKISGGSSPAGQIEKVFNYWQSEVLLKAGAEKLFDRFVGREDYKVRGCWDSIRIVLRHRYHTRVRDWGMWFDLVDLLKKNGKDIRNPHYICPDNLKKAHDEQLAICERNKEKQRRERAKEEARRLADKLRNDGKTNVEYTERMGAYLGVIIKSKDITLRPLQNIQEFFDEGSELHHCVFTNRYYEHKDCLIIGARVKGRRTETIEVDTKNWKITQCRGRHNQSSKYHNQIVRLMNKNMDKLRRACI